MIRSPLLLALCAAVAFPGCAQLAPTSNPTRTIRGPLAVRTDGPIVATLLQFRPRPAETTPVGRVRLAVDSSYSSMFEDGTDGISTVVFDGEVLRTAAALRTGLSPDTDVELELPLVYGGSGFLDSFIERWHALLGLPNGGRADREQGEYDMRVVKNGQTVYEMEGYELEFGDVPIVLTHRLIREEDAGLSLDVRAGLELPTGSESSGIGNGGIDWGGGVMLEKSYERYTFTAAAYFVDAATPDSFADAGVDMEAPRYLHAGAECRWNELLSLVAGLRASTPATHDVTIEEVNGHVLDLDLGVVIGEPTLRHRFTVGLSEDLIAQSGPDFAVYFGWAYVF